MSTGSELINRSTRQLLSGVTEVKNKLSAGVTASGTSLAFTYDLGPIREGQVIEVDSELMYVWSSESGSKTATVERGWNGTTAAVHATNAIVTVNPRFPRAQLLEALNYELQELSSPVHGLFKVVSFDIENYNGSDIMVNVPQISEAIDLLNVKVRYTSTDYKTIRKVKLLRDMPTDDFSSGFVLKFEEWVRSGRVRVTYKAPFTQLAVETDDLQSVAGLPESCEDIISLGIQIRLMAPREMKRNFTESQGDTRRADEVPPGVVGNSISNLMRMRRDRITAEAAKLARQYPTFMSKD